MDAETTAAIEARAIALKDEISTDMKAGFASLGAQIDAKRATWGKKIRAEIEAAPLPAARVIGTTCLIFGGLIGFFSAPYISAFLK